MIELSGEKDLKEIFLKIENLLERLRLEYHRDVADRIFYVEGELLDIKRGLRRINETLELLVNQLKPMRVEVVGERKPLEEAAKSEVVPTKVQAPRRKSVSIRRITGVTKPVTVTSESTLKFLTSEANDTELKVLKLLYERPEYGSKGSTEIAKAIDKVREHTARTLKKLCENGFLIRDESSTPFTYTIPKEVAKALKEHLKSVH